MSIEAMKMALEALELTADRMQKQRDAVTALRAAIAEAEKQEPVAYVTGYYDGHLVVRPIEHVVLPTGMALYTHPPRREWVGLTDEEIAKTADAMLACQIESYETSGVYDFARAIEAKLKEKNP